MDDRTLLESFRKVDLNNTRKWDEAKSLAPKAETLLNQKNVLKTHLNNDLETYVDALCKLAEFYRIISGETEKSIEMADRAVSACGSSGFFSSSKVSPLAEAHCYRVQAACLDDAGMLKKARDALMTGLKKIPKDAKIDKARMEQNLGAVLLKMGNLKKATGAFEKALKIFRKAYGKDRPHKHCAAVLCNLGAAYIQRGALDKAERSYETALSMFRALYGEHVPHPHIATVLSALAYLYDERNEPKKAIELREKVVKMRLALHGEQSNHPKTAAALGGLGNTLRKQGKLKRAKKVFKRAISMHSPRSKKTLARNGMKEQAASNPELATLIHGLANVSHKQGDMKSAREQYESALTMFKDAHGETSHPHIATLHHNLGTVMREQGELKEARESFEKSLSMKKVIHGEDATHPEIGHTLLGLSAVDIREGNHESAAKRKEAARKVLKKMFPDRRATFVWNQSLAKFKEDYDNTISDTDLAGNDEDDTKTNLSPTSKAKGAAKNRWNRLRETVKTSVRRNSALLLSNIKDDIKDDDIEKGGGGVNATIVEMKGLSVSENKTVATELAGQEL